MSYSYESNINKDPEKERVKPKFASTILFVEDYLETVVKQDGAFADRKQNKLTYEVRNDQLQSISWFWWDELKTFRCPKTPDGSLVFQLASTYFIQLMNTILIYEISNFNNCTLFNMDFWEV